MKLNLTTEQVNQILNALAQQPYIQVHELIATIQQQGQAQLKVSNSEEGQQEQPIIQKPPINGYATVEEN